MPRIEKIQGFQRYVAFLARDGRYGSISVFDTREAADQATAVAREWAQGVPEHKNNRLEMDLRGEMGLAITGSTPLSAPDLHGAIRLYRTGASFDEVNEAIEADAGKVIRGMRGLARYSTVKCEDGRIATLSSFDSEESSRALTGKARELRQQGGSRLAKALPHDPEVVEAKVLFAVLQS